MPHVRIQWKGRTKRTPAQQVALAVRILDDRFFDDVYERALAELGELGGELGPLDTGANTLRDAVERKNRATMTAPLVDALDPRLAALVGDFSASTLVDLYSKAGGRPLPTAGQEAATEAGTYWLGAGYAGVLIDWSERTERFALPVIKPSDLELKYTSEDPTEPTIITHYAKRPIGRDGAMVDVREVYDLTDLDAPSYRVFRDDDDVTEAVHGQTYVGEAYYWRLEGGRPFHRIVVLGNNRHPFRTNGLIETTLKACVYWSWWGGGLKDASHPSRHVRGLTLVGADSESSGRTVGSPSGAQIVHEWQNTDPDKAGEAWQWGPGFDPEVTGRAIRSWEQARVAALGLPINFEHTGGEPTEHELKAREEAIATTFPEMRRFCSELLRRCAATANRLDAIEGSDLDESPYGVLFRGEVQDALAAATNESTGTTEGGAADGSEEDPSDG